MREMFYDSDENREGICEHGLTMQTWVEKVIECSRIQSSGNTRLVPKRGCKMVIMDTRDSAPFGLSSGYKVPDGGIFIRWSKSDELCMAEEPISTK